MFYTGRLRLEVQHFTLLHTVFDRRGIPFAYLSLTNNSFHILCLELCIPFNYCKCTFFKYEQITKLENFLDFFTAKKSLPFQVILQTKMKDFPLRPEKGTPFGWSLPVWAIIASTLVREKNVEWSDERGRRIVSKYKFGICYTGKRPGLHKENCRN